MYQQNNMKKILFILLLLPFISKAQLEQNHPEPGGHLFVGVRSTSWLRPPSDTATNKTGIARIGTALYIGNGTYWSASGLIYTGTTPISVSGTVISMAQASAIASGYLSSTDWSLFNAKQDALVSGTNIKTVNSSSILGSGNLSVGTVTGTGTANTMTKWTSSTAVGNALMTDDGTNVSLIGTSASGVSTPFTVIGGTGTSAGGLKMGAYNATYGGFWSNNVTPSTSNYALISTGATTDLNSTSNIDFTISDAAAWRINSLKSLLPTATTNTVDLGGTSNLIRSGYFGTSVTSPLLIGGTTTTSSLTYKTTTGVGTTGADHIFQVGNNGATEAMRILNNGNVGIGIAAPLTLLQISRGTASTADADIPQILLENTNTTSTSFAINRIRTGTGYAAGYPELWLQASGGTGGLTTIRGVSNHRMAFKTNDTEAMTISTSQNLGIGTGATVSARLHTISTTEQLRLGYDASNYYSTTVGSTGIATFNAVGSGSSFEFSDRVAVPKLKGNSSTPSIAVGTGAASVSLSTNSTDLAGEMVINTDAVTAAGATIATVTFSTAYSTAPFVTFSATNDDASSTNNNWYVVPTTTGFAFKSFSSGNDPLALTTLKFSYHVIQ